MRSDLFEMADVLSKQPLPSGNRLAILTNAGGPGVLATDALASHGGVVAELSHKTVEALNLVLPSAWSHGNPIDVLGDATAKHYADSLEIVAQVKGWCFGFWRVGYGRLGWKMGPNEAIIPSCKAWRLCW